jgi:hypothetical protein
VELTKLEAAERQLRQAIQLFFGHADEVSIHALTAAACQILRDLAKHRGAAHPLHDGLIPLLRPSMVKEFLRVVRSNENFFKHADTDPDASLTFNPESTEFLLFEAVVAHAMLTGFGLPETCIFFLWFCARHADILAREGPLKDLLERIDPVVLASAVDTRAGGLDAIEWSRSKFGEHIPVPGIPWPSTR